MKKPQTECRQCGICCTKGGPALHQEDLKLIHSGEIPIANLITIRKGELVYKPNDDLPQAASCELVKICGTGKEWQCSYYDGDNKTCSIYHCRPLSCRKLQCWNTEAVEKLVEKDTLSRFDIVGSDEPLYQMIKEHDTQCQCPDMMELLDSVQQNSLPSLTSLEFLVNEDISYRTAAVQRFKITLAEELFYFGRPLFQILQQVGVNVSEDGGELKLSWPSK